MGYVLKMVFVEADTWRTRATPLPWQLWRADSSVGWILLVVLHAARQWFARH